MSGEQHRLRRRRGRRREHAGQVVGLLPVVARGLLLAASCAFLAFDAGSASGQTIAITNARIHPVASPVIENGTIVIRDGRIAAVGADVRAPAGAQVIDGTGKVVTPGFLDSFTQLGVVEIGAVDETVDATSDNDDFTAAFSVKYGINPRSTLIPIARTGGITRAVVAPGTGASIIAGQGVLIDLRGDRRADMIQREDVAMFGIMGGRAAEMTGGARGLTILRLREALQDARDYAANRAAYASGDRRDYALSRLDLQALIPVVRGEMPFAVAVDRSSDILAALDLRDEFGLDMILLSAAEGWLVADEIARASVPVVINPMTNIPGYDALVATLENAARLADAGVEVVFASFDAHNARNLRQAAGNAVANGMAWDAALRSITAAPAALWGISDEYGTLEPGKDADLVVWSGDPFELLTVAEHVFIEGRDMPDETRQTELLERYLRVDGERLPQSFQHD
ncbi:MAG: amidohydrolase family protein [Longimicrobiales bacterium]